MTPAAVRRVWLRKPLLAALARTRLPVLIGVACLATFVAPLLREII